MRSPRRWTSGHTCVWVSWPDWLRWVKPSTVGGTISWGWVLDCINRRKLAEYQHALLSASWLYVQCDQLLYASSPVISPPQWTMTAVYKPKQDFSSLRCLCKKKNLSHRNMESKQRLLLFESRSCCIAKSSLKPITSASWVLEWQVCGAIFSFDFRFVPQQGQIGIHGIK